MTLSIDSAWIRVQVLLPILVLTIFFLPGFVQDRRMAAWFCLPPLFVALAANTRLWGWLGCIWIFVSSFFFPFFPLMFQYTTPIFTIHRTTHGVMPFLPFPRSVRFSLFFFLLGVFQNSGVISIHYLSTGLFSFSGAFYTCFVLFCPHSSLLVISSGWFFLAYR